MNLLESAILLLMHTLFPMLRLAPGDSFPRPLSREQEQEEEWVANIQLLL